MTRPPASGQQHQQRRRPPGTPPATARVIWLGVTRVRSSERHQQRGQRPGHEAVPEDVLRLAGAAVGVADAAQHGGPGWPSVSRRSAATEAAAPAQEGPVARHDRQAEGDAEQGVYQRAEADEAAGAAGGRLLPGGAAVSRERRRPGSSGARWAMPERTGTGRCGVMLAAGRLARPSLRRWPWRLPGLGRRFGPAAGLRVRPGRGGSAARSAAGARPPVSTIGAGAVAEAAAGARATGAVALE